MSELPGQRVVVYTGVFDPIHLGHLDIIQRACAIFEQVVVGVGINPEKTSFFSMNERVELVRKVVQPLTNVEVRPFTGLTVRFVRQVGARLMIRGLRTLSDMEYEFTMSLTNQSLDPGIETLFLMASEEYSHISSTLIRQIATLEGPVEKFLPAEIRVALQARVQDLNKKMEEESRGQQASGSSRGCY